MSDKDKVKTALEALKAMDAADGDELQEAHTAALEAVESLRTQLTESVEDDDLETAETPEEWDEDEWDERLDGARAKAELPPTKGTLTTKTIDGREYYYLQWREGDTVTSQYVAPVDPA